MNPRLQPAQLFFAVVLIAALTAFHSWILFPLLHLRPLLLGLLPLISFFPFASMLLGKFSRKSELSRIDRLIYSLFGAYVLAALCAFLLLTLHIGYSWAFISVSFLLILLSWNWWKDVLLHQRRSLFSDSAFLQAPLIERLLLSAALLLGLAAALLPPIGYDAHEYHLAAPQRYLACGGWTAFPNNLYCAFPMNIEMLYSWPIAAQSAAGCTVINYGFACLGALAVWRLGTLWGLSPFSLLAPLFFLSTGIVQRLIIQANIDLALASSAAVLLLAYEHFRADRRPVHAAVMSLALGFAFGSKYIAALSMGFPFLIVLLFDAKSIHRQNLLRLLLLAWAGAAALFLPWAIRNVILYKNPVYPLLFSTLGGSPDFFHELFQRAHASQWVSFGQTIFDFIVLPFQKSLAESIPMGFSCVWMLAVWALPGAGRRHPVYRSLLFAAAAYLAWFFLTQRNDRFLASILPSLALLGAYGVHAVSADSFRRILRGLILLLVTIQLYGASRTILQTDALEYLLSPTLEENYLSRRMPHFRAIEWLNREYEKPRSRVGAVLFIGEAQSYGARFPLLAPTVFNHHPLEKGLDRTITHLLVNRSELNRLRKGYGPLGWPLGDFLQQWLQQNQDRLTLVFDAYPENPELIAVYEISRESSSKR
ncbi:MAG: ArnT family glycosyltransferase [Candidatus Hinthialibacter sp.]